MQPTILCGFGFRKRSIIGQSAPNRQLERLHATAADQTVLRVGMGTLGGVDGNTHGASSTLGEAESGRENRETERTRDDDAVLRADAQGGDIEPGRKGVEVNNRRWRG